ncbi:hypothetical protein EDC04DRAFT_2603252 [Pisolithus marmoratus]|nr:hypothetical protein EDC04DRAFT_2603252 [Pisolithus marmoratus]
MAQMQPWEAIAKPASKMPPLVLTLQKVLDQRSPKWTFFMVPVRLSCGIFMGNVKQLHVTEVLAQVTALEDNVSPVVMVWDLGEHRNVLMPHSDSVVSFVNKANHCCATTSMLMVSHSVVMAWVPGQSLSSKSYAFALTTCTINGLDKLSPPVGVGVLPPGKGPARFILTQLLKLNGALRVVIAANKLPLGI